MTPAFALLPTAERAARIEEAAERLNLSAVIVEKDFWVCWILARAFSTPELAPHLVFKGGTSLSKVFGAIQRFSEDVDLSVSPAFLGWTETDLDDASSRSMRGKLFAKLEKACIDRVQGDVRETLEQSIRKVLGTRSDGGPWLVYEIDTISHSPDLVFQYPQAIQTRLSYIAPTVKLEFGSLTDQRPIGKHRIQAFVAEAFPEGAFEDWHTEVVALEIERTFWEKATILHAECHRPAEQKIRERLARHYADLAALWKHPSRQIALENLALLKQVGLFKSRFFSSSWSSYETAYPPSLRLCPSDSRLVEIERDYREMDQMFLTAVSPFSEIVRTLREAEETINGG